MQINNYCHLTSNDIDFGTTTGHFVLFESGWNKIRAYYILNDFITEVYKRNNKNAYLFKDNIEKFLKKINYNSRDFKANTKEFYLQEALPKLTIYFQNTQLINDLDLLTFAKSYTEEQLLKHFKKITGHKIYALSNCTINDLPRSDFNAGSVQTLLECINFIKQDVPEIYVAPGKLYEDLVRHSLDNYYNVKQWTTFSMSIDEKPPYGALIVNNKPVKFTAKTEDKIINDGNQFKLGEVFVYDKLEKEAQTYNAKNDVKTIKDEKVDFRNFGGLVDGYPTFEDNTTAPFNMLEVKTHSYHKIAQTEGLNDLKQKVYTPIIKEQTIQVQIDTDSKKSRFTRKILTNPISVKDCKWHKNNKGGYSKVITLKGTMPVWKNDKYSKAYGYNELDYKKFHQQGEFKINNAEYYCQAAFYALATFIKNKILTKKGLVYPSNSDLLVQDLRKEKLNDVYIDQDWLKFKVLFAMGNWDNLAYFNGDFANYQVWDNNAWRTLHDDEFKCLFSIENIETEIFVPSKLKIVNETGHLINFIELIRNINNTYNDFLHAKPISIQTSKIFLNGLKEYFASSEHKVVKQLSSIYNQKEK